MTIHHAGASQPSFPSHRVCVGSDFVVLTCGKDEILIRDADVNSVTWSTFARRRPGTASAFRAKRTPPSAGFRVTTLVHGPNATKIQITLPWKRDSQDPLHQYRLRIARRVAKRWQALLQAGDRVQQNDWEIDKDRLSWKDGQQLDLKRIQEVRFLGDEVAVWITGEPTPLVLTSDAPDQLIIGELLHAIVETNAHRAKGGDHNVAHEFGRMLLQVKPTRKALATAARSDLNEAKPALFTLFTLMGISLLIIYIGRGIGVGRWGMPQALNWIVFAKCFAPTATLLFAAINLVWLTKTAQRIRNWRSIEVYERGLKVIGRKQRTIRFAHLWDYRLTAKAVYVGTAYSHTQYTLRTAVPKTAYDLEWEEFSWSDTILSRGELGYLNDLLRVATNGRMQHEPDKAALFAATSMLPTHVVSV